MSVVPDTTMTEELEKLDPEELAQACPLSTRPFVCACCTVDLKVQHCATQQFKFCTPTGIYDIFDVYYFAGIDSLGEGKRD